MTDLTEHQTRHCLLCSYFHIVHIFPKQLRSSFNKAFSKKGSKSGAYADIEEIATPESSLPSSPKVHNIDDNPQHSAKSSSSSSSG